LLQARAAAVLASYRVAAAAGRSPLPLPADEEGR